MFKPVTPRVNYPKLEEEILQFWKDNRIFERSIEAREKGPRFTLFEGPPTANGNPGIHHVLARAFKDVIPRYKVMKGYYAPRKAGWDTHGLPVELEVEKQLGFSGKPQIEAYGIAKFNEKCRASVFKYLTQWNTLTDRIGYWTDLQHPYVTMENSYIESVWWAIKQMWDKELIYQGYRVTPHCPRCGTSLSSHEVAQGYQENTEDPSVFIKFKIDPASLKGSDAKEILRKFAAEKPLYLLAWTTTPWTLPGNTALAVNETADYVVLDNGAEYLIFAGARQMAAGLEQAKVAATIKGKELSGYEGVSPVEYEPLFNPADYGVDRMRFVREADPLGTVHVRLVAQPPDPNLRYHVIAADFVSMDDGTGIVHVAPSYGEVDYEAGRAKELSFVHNVDLQGKIIGNYPFAGKFVKSADPLVEANLKERNLLFKSEKIRHTYPFCWRCGTPLLYYAKETWYIKTTAIKDKLIAGNEQINWFPDHIKYGRFGDWLQNNVDWAFSRERYWGTPLPVWKCESCGQFDCVGTVEELKSRPGAKGVTDTLDLHRPYVDEVTYNCPKCSGTMKRIPEVLDCWFDSGAMPFAQNHYPVENKTMFEDGRFPADFICEGVDQTRGWFYSLHAISELINGQPAFKNVICLGHILDAKGEKMSKTRGNVVDPVAIINKYGADALRWYFYTSSPPGNVRRFTPEGVAEVTRSLFTTWWNVYSFFVMYANIDSYQPPSQEPGCSAEAELDRWILSELNELIIDVESDLEAFDPTNAGRHLEEFVDYLSNWYVRRSRRRFWKSESDADKQSAYNTLYRCLVTLTKLMAPFTPFLADEIYRSLVPAVIPGAPPSVHLADWPVADKSMINKELAEATRLAMKVCSMGRSVRSEAGVKVRQPLAKMTIQVNAAAQMHGLRRLAPQIMEEVNVKEIEIIQGKSVISMPSLTEGDVTVAVDVNISEELAGEGMAREITHRIQTMRRTANFEIADHIILYYEGGDYIAKVMKDFAEYLKLETLCDQILPSIPADESVSAEPFKLGGYDLKLGVKKV